jgi:hypothetical protein
LERQRVGVVQHHEFLHEHFHLPGGDLVVVRSFGTVADFAGDLNDRFRVKLCRVVEHFLRKISRIENRLSASFAVAQVDKEHAAEIAPGMYPAGQRDSLPRLGRAQFIAMMCSFHSVTGGQISGEPFSTVVIFGSYGPVDAGPPTRSADTCPRMG